jgi:hypothetical protein
VSPTSLWKSSVWRTWFYGRQKNREVLRLKNVFRVLWSWGKFYPYYLVESNLTRFELMILRANPVGPLPKPRRKRKKRRASHPAEKLRKLLRKERLESRSLAPVARFERAEGLPSSPVLQPVGSSRPREVVKTTSVPHNLGNTHCPFGHEYRTVQSGGLIRGPPVEGMSLYAKVWRDIESGNYTGDRLRTKYAGMMEDGVPIIDQHRLLRADEVYWQNHTRTCDCNPIEDDADWPAFYF